MQILWSAILILMFSTYIFAGKDECYSNDCISIITANGYLLSATSIQSDYDFGIAKQLTACNCLDEFEEYKGFRLRLNKMIEMYQSSTIGCDTKLCDSLINSSNAMYYYSSINQIRNQNDYEIAKKIVENCDCWITTQGAQGATYTALFKKMKGMLLECKQWLIERKKLREIANQQKEEEQRQEEEQAQQQVEKDSIRMVEEPKEIASLLNKPGNIDECVSRCNQYKNDFNVEPSVCSKLLIAKIKALSPNKITSQEVADIYFTPITELTEWYMEGKNTGYIQIGGRIAWVSGNLAEMNMGSSISFLIRFSAPWVIREGMPFMGFGKPVGNVTYPTALGASRTLPCLQLVWLYRPSLDKSDQSNDYNSLPPVPNMQKLLIE